MSKKTIGVFSFVGLFLIFALSVVFWAISVSNRERGLRNSFEARIKENQTNYDNMWKTIQQKYQIQGEYAKAFQDVVMANAQNRAGGGLIKMVTEAIPGLDASIYKELMATIEGKRDEFKRAQDIQIDLKREHDNLLVKFPSSLVVGSRPSFQLQLVTSTRTGEAFQSGIDDDVTLK